MPRRSCLFLVMIVASATPEGVGCRRGPRATTPDLQRLFSAVRNDTIKIGTYRPSGSQFALLQREVFVSGPPEALALVKLGDPRMLEGLIELLRDPSRCWAAEILLVRLTRREEKLVDTYMASPDLWWAALGQTSHRRWTTWLTGTRGRLRWDAGSQSFTVVTP